MKLSTLFSIHDSLTWTSDNYDNDLTSAFWDSSLTTPFQCASPKFATIWLELQAITIVISCLHSGTLVWLLPSNVPLPPNLPSSQSAWRSTTKGHPPRTELPIQYLIFRIPELSLSDPIKNGVYPPYKESWSRKTPSRNSVKVIMWF